MKVKLNIEIANTRYQEKRKEMDSYIDYKIAKLAEDYEKTTFIRLYDTVGLYLGNKMILSITLKQPTDVEVESACNIKKYLSPEYILKINLNDYNKTFEFEKDEQLNRILRILKDDIDINEGDLFYDNK